MMAPIIDHSIPLQVRDKYEPLDVNSCDTKLPISEPMMPITILPTTPSSRPINCDANQPTIPPRIRNITILTGYPLSFKIQRPAYRISLHSAMNFLTSLTLVDLLLDQFIDQVSPPAGS